MESLLHSVVTRRAMLAATAIVAPSLLPAVASGSAAPLVLANDPAAHLRVFRKLTGSEVDGEMTMLYYSGTTFGVDEQARTTALYGMHGLSPSRSWRQPDGSVRFAAMEIGVFTDLATGEVLDTWLNPYTNERVDVWHLRNGPINYAINPAADLDTAGWKLLRKADPTARGFRLPISIVGDDLILSVDAQATRRSPLLPEEWPRESSGAQLVYSEHNTFHARAADVLDPGIGSPAVVAAWHSLKPWRPWMLMGQSPGRIYNHLVARKVTTLDAVPMPVRAHVERHFPAFLKAPDGWTGEYVDDWTHFKAARKPAKPAGATR